MKITDQFKRKETTYGNIKAGIVFKYKNEYYMRTEDLTDNYYDIYNCVKLDSGEFDSFDNDDMVEVVDAEIIVK